MKASVLIRALACAPLVAVAVHAQVYITEFFYQGFGGTTGNEHEFVELTNVGTTAVDVTGWYYRDSTNSPATPFSLSGFGSIAPGESVIITDISEADFRTVWPDLAPDVRILGGSNPGLGRDDAIRIFDSNDVIVDQLSYGDQDYPGTERFRQITAITTRDNLGQNSIVGWYFSNTQEGLTNITSINGDIGNPGYVNFELAAVPEPATYAALLALAVLAGVALHRGRRTVQQ
ncbi:PEP-CTERM putative exosortase interaction domain-containing protein [Opitutaceae bacterium TAV1]|nr:PEP-CTERM putative exosortase interaction domain-containing protein [Opitutaceae bacterium TAV1]